MELVKELQNNSTNASRVIAIDGYIGIRKSNLAYRIASELKIDVISIDNFVSINKDRFYLNALNFGILKSKIDGLKKYKESFIIEGICILDVLKRINTQSNILIYCKKVDRNGAWIQRGKIYYKENSADESYYGDITKYHYKYKPDDKCDYLVKIRE